MIKGWKIGGGYIKKKFLIVPIIFIILLGFSALIITSNHQNSYNIIKKDIGVEKNNGTNDTTSSIVINDDNSIKEEDNLKPSNEDIVGSIKISGTNINEYIVQGDDNEYYLNHNLDKEEDIAGSVFLDYRNNFSDKKLLIFGHNARKLKTVPFHDLEKYMDESFYKDNKYIDLTLNDETSKWQVFSVMTVEKGNNTHMKLRFTDQEWINHIDWLKSNSLYDTKVDVGASDNIVILQTCNYKPENTYLLISAKKI